METKHKIICLLFLLSCVLSSPGASVRVKGSPHDLTVVGSGDICSFCHTPHGSDKKNPLWSHKLSDAVYTIYQSTSLDAKVGQPTGMSKLCLSCHDGVVALTHKIKGKEKEKGGIYITAGALNLGTDLSDDHPISFVYSDSLTSKDRQIRPPLNLPKELKLDKFNELQCTTCHDPHDNQYGDFLVMNNIKSAMCISCHNMDGWPLSSHESSSAAVLAADDNYLKKSKYNSVEDNACSSCHRPHLAGGNQRLLHFEKSEKNCLNCHNGSVAKTNMEAAITGLSGHNVKRYQDVHDLRESVTTSPEHVECVDCHNPHATQNISTQAPSVPGVMQKVSGVTISGSVTNEAQNEYEVCFKCHGDNPNRIESEITRNITQTNTRLEFDSMNPSFHPVAGLGVNQDVPSLKEPLSIASMIYCTDCHNADSAAVVKGPHGSSFSPLLAYNYETSDFTFESEFAYELCYKCHSRNSILNDESFPMHKKHLDENIPCSACHDPHGISFSQGTSMENSHLINFDTSIVQERASGELGFTDGSGTFQGECSVLCHGEDHDQKSY
jgi:predicted CXXCH cytochrome family protein